ncbi:THO complex subunit 2 isoform X2 [Pectinophora gossypiella]|uniref:THO complex subunit 2 isoform X2 n=1 Tax=Pectinophora gossypiella TaxID=13191 RepID=UPI00214F4F37|nr:THO complex subunit 2 isoform X2 [Pectinophora gossypiella]
MGTYAKFVSDYCKSWEKSGKEQFIKTVTQYIKDDDKSPLFTKSGKLSGVSQSMYDLLLSGLRGTLKKDAVLSVLRDITALHADVPSILLDVVCVLDAETCTDVHSEERMNFCYIVRELESFMSDKLLKERLEIDTLQDVGTLKNKNFYTKFIKIKTKLYYKQRKFNLFREESEGYAKLIVELNQEISEDTEWKTILEIIQSLIGCFNLDPNRVLDIILESFEARPYLDKLFISLIKNYMGDPQVISEVLGFKLGNMEVLESYKEPPPLMTVIALLLQHQVISLDDIYPWLRPDDSIMAKEADKEIKAAQDYIRRLNIVSTKGPQVNGPAEYIEEKADPQEYWSNQKLVLSEALLKVTAWREFAALAARLPTSVMPPRPALALCNMLHAIVEPLYRNHCRVAPKIIGKPVPPLKSSLAPRACKTFEDLRETVIPALILLGPSLHYDPILMYKIVRILRTSRGLSEDPLHYDALTVLDAAILPALTLMEGNCCMAEEVYTLLKLYPYQCRYCLYSRWKNESGERIPSLIRVRGNSLQRIKHIMKRVSKENVKPQGRLIGKLSHAAPAFLFDYMLLQIQTYDNLIGPVVESLKYLTSLSLDVLGYCLLEALCAGRGARGAAHPPWLQALAAFAGAAFKKHNIELTALLQFVANRLKAQQSQDLLILKEIVQKMAGIEAVEEMTPDQLDAMAGGELLKGEAGYFSQVRNTRRSSARLKEAIVGNNLDIGLCILSAQQRHSCVWTEIEDESPSSGEPPGSQLKVVGRLADQCQDALVQLGTFLASSHAPDEYAARLPPLQELLRDYHVDADVAFFLHRPVLAQKIAARIESLRKSSDSKSDNQEKSVERYTTASKEVLEPVLVAISPLLPSKVWEDISPEFYVTFWSLSMYDLKVPEESYDREIDKLKTVASATAKDTSQGTKGKKEVERYNTLIDKLQEERRRQQEHVSRVSARLQRECAGWFPARAAKSAKNETVTRLMQLCLFPRCVFTAADALYCAEFVHTVHALKTPNFSTLLCYDRLFCDITYSVMSCTEGEAARYGTFLCKVLGTAMRWHGDKAAFHRECAHYPGFVTKYRVSNQFTEANDHVGYENYRHLCHKWHYKITKAMVVCLDSGDYVQIRNALIVLIRVLPHFPVLAKLAAIIERKIEKVKEEEKTQRQDLFVLATGYSGQLRNKVPHMMRENDFHQVVQLPAVDKHKPAAAELPAKHDPEAAASPPHVMEVEKRETRNSDRRRDDSDREKESKRERSSMKEKERIKEEIRIKERSPRERSHREERYLESVSPPHDHRHQPDDIEREVKRRKVESSGNGKGSKEVEERSPEKEKRKAKLRGDERKERKMSRKRDRAEESTILEQKRRRDEQKVVLKMGGHQNGSQEDHHYEKYHKREKSPFRDRSHEEARDKQRSNESKIRR